MKFLILLFSPFLSLPTLAVDPGALWKPRYCGEPERYADGTIKRSAAVIAAFKREHPCPSTGLSVGRCDGWEVDHVLPLASCGCDSVSNLQWLPVQIKRCAGQFCKDRFERDIYRCPE